jgi:hypothetical protein
MSPEQFEWKRRATGLVLLYESLCVSSGATDREVIRALRSTKLFTAYRSSAFRRIRRETIINVLNYHQSLQMTQNTED